MKYGNGACRSFQRNSNNATIKYSAFSNRETDEFHLCIKPAFPASFDEQLADSLTGICEFINSRNSGKPDLVFVRFFVSDFSNQAHIEDKVRIFGNGMFERCAVSVVQQPPLPCGKLAAWAYLVRDRANRIHLIRDGKTLMMQRGDFKHIWHLGLVNTDGHATTSYDQTTNVLERFGADLMRQGLSLPCNCIRTWLFVRDVDCNYQGLVDARRRLFRNMGMTKETHYVASTGIEGKSANARSSVMMDAYSIGGIRQDQIRFLKAPKMLNPTHQYGVTFERGTRVDYGDRRHIFISGTASIDKAGQVVHIGDVAGQTRRALENINALLADADAGIEDICHMIVYLRDIADFPAVDHYLENHHPQIPIIILLAPVCRPKWLVEIECMAVKKILKPGIPTF